MAIFLDDGLGGGVITIKAKINSLIVRADLTRYGFLINEEKSFWEPVQVITWLGTVFDTCQGFISVTERRISKLKSSVIVIRKVDHKTVKVRDLASVVGQVILLTPCVENVARITTRYLYANVNQKLPWNSEVVLTKEACDELAFWSENVDSLNFIAPGCLYNLLLILSVPTRRITPVVLSLTMSTIRFVIRIGVLQKVPKAPRGGNLEPGQGKLRNHLTYPY